MTDPALPPADGGLAPLVRRTYRKPDGRLHLDYRPLGAPEPRFEPGALTLVDTTILHDDERKET